MSKSILAKYKVEGLVIAVHKELMEFSGLGPAKARELVACMELMDHVIVAPQKWVSMCETGFLAGAIE
jgi:DNA repair protein RadC